MSNEQTTNESGDDVNGQESVVEEVVLKKFSDEDITEVISSSDETSAAVMEQLRIEREQAREDRLRALAEVSNNQRRASENERRVELASRVSLIRRILPVLDQFDMAASQDSITTEQLVEGFKIAGNELLKILTDQGVVRLEPAIGDVFDPMKHEAMLRQESDEIEADHIVMIMQAGYMIGDQVIRPAKVAVAS
ncbi:MAG: nucleotide exchange factor GrpE [Phycisphaerales bacterium]|nr:nucleotide exchange factor GrpE [Phycisphaerales bacterium]|tara:strand:- start:3077 stop:3658 length:582 start_codon:yes stop_codon:yes gene_type:complete